MRTRNTLLFATAIASAVACSKAPKAKEFSSPDEASSALIKAASNNDVTALLGILGPDAKDLVSSNDPVRDKERTLAFAEKAREKNAIEVDPNDPARATLVVGRDDWPVPIPLEKEKNGKWRFDVTEGKDEMLRRRIGENELDVITIARGYVEAQKEYASEIRDGSDVHQYARRVVSTPGKQDGLAWQKPDGTWAGPVGESAARAIDKGYSARQPYHGYYFKVLEGQGPSARLGKLDYVVDGAMIGGFGLVAWPADYGVTGVQTFMVSYDGVVYQKDLGRDTATIASGMDRYDPDASWMPTEDSA
jgi:hypothetical protein